MNRTAEREFEKGRERLAADFAGLVEDAETLLKATAHYSGDGLAAARAKVEEHIGTIRDAVSDAEGVARQHSRKAIRSADRAVHKYPWQAIGVAMTAGIVLGYLSARR